MKKPNFFIIGAPKCGTTSLAAWLAEHPNIFMSPIKEPQFFNKDGLTTTATLEDYEALFASAGTEHIAVGEASAHYLYSREAVPGILDYNPDAKFIVCLRNPIEMVQSLHSGRVWQGRDNVKDFAQAWRLQEDRKMGKHIPRAARRDPERLQYGAYCRLGEQLSRLYKQGPRLRTLPLLLDDIRDNPRREYLKVLAFLSVPDDNRRDFPVHNRRKETRYPFLAYMIQTAGELKRMLGIKKIPWAAGFLSGINTKPPQGGLLPAELLEELKVYFNSDIDLLGKLLNRDLSEWLK